MILCVSFSYESAFNTISLGAVSKDKLLKLPSSHFFARLVRRKKAILRLGPTEHIVSISVALNYSVSRSIRCKEFQTLLHRDRQKAIQARLPREAHAQSRACESSMSLFHNWEKFYHRLYAIKL
jgi:hypothetical protein